VRCRTAFQQSGFLEGTLSDTVMASLQGTPERNPDMSKVFSAHAVPVDGYITGRGLGGVTHLPYAVER
jgi:hypothetical protein